MNTKPFNRLAVSIIIVIALLWPVPTRSEPDNQPQAYYGVLVLERTTNFIDWVEIARTNASWNNEFTFEDWDALPQAFYRAVVL